MKGIYVSATPEDGKFAIRGGPLSLEYLQKIRQEGLALRDARAKERAEAQRIETIRRQKAAAHAANHAQIEANWQRVKDLPPPPPGVALSPPGPPPDPVGMQHIPTYERSATPSATLSTRSQFEAHPLTPFDPPASPPNTGPNPAIPTPR